MYNGFRFQPGFWETYRDAKEIWSIAGHLHNLVHNSSSRTRIQRNTAELDELLHGLRGDVAAWCGSGSHGCSFRLKRKVAALDEAVEHLMEDVGVTSKHVPPVSSPAAPPSLPPAGTAPSVQGAPLGLAGGR